MITRESLDSTPRKNISKDPELTKERVDRVWKSLSHEQKSKIYRYGILPSAVTQTRFKGRISIRVAAAISLISGLDPYYLIGEVDTDCKINSEYDIENFIDDISLRNMTNKSYRALKHSGQLVNTETHANNEDSYKAFKSNGLVNESFVKLINEIANDTHNESVDDIVDDSLVYLASDNVAYKESVEDELVDNTALPDFQIDYPDEPIITLAKEYANFLPDDIKDDLLHLPDETIKSLLRNLQLRSNYSRNSKDLLLLLYLILLK